jgi:hypothetical protein
MLTLAALCLAAAATNEIGSSAHSVTGVTHACHASPLAILTGITFVVFVPRLQIYVVYTYGCISFSTKCHVSSSFSRFLNTTIKPAET